MIQGKRWEVFFSLGEINKDIYIASDSSHHRSISIDGNRSNRTWIIRINRLEILTIR